MSNWKGIGVWSESPMQSIPATFPNQEHQYTTSSESSVWVWAWGDWPCNGPCSTTERGIRPRKTASQHVLKGPDHDYPESRWGGLQTYPSARAGFGPLSWQRLPISADCITVWARCPRPSPAREPSACQHCQQNTRQDTEATRKVKLPEGLGICQQL